MEEIIDELRELAKTGPEFTPRPFLDPNNRWLARSAIQKAMRRGRIDEALGAAEILYDYDASQLWRTLATIIIEDIGIGDLDLISYSCCTTLKAVRDQVGAERLMAAMIQRACGAVKSQSCCELDLGVSKDPAREEVKKYFVDASEDELLKMAWSSATDVQARHMAMMALRNKLRHQGYDALIPALTMIRDTLPETGPIRRAAMLSFERPTDTMNVALYSVLRGMVSEDGMNLGWSEVVPEEFPPEVMIGSVSSCARDMHERSGKLAIKAYYRWLRDEGGPEWVQQVPENDAVRAIGSLVFQVEGGLLDRRIRSPFLNDLQMYQQRNFAIGYGIPVELLDDPGLDQMKNDVRDTIPRLNELRVWSARL